MTTWSCFNEKAGLYDYYESPGSYALNADLPIPKLPSAGNRIGVAAIEAGRRLPGDAKSVGRGWKAKGLVARCDGGGIAGLGDFLDFSQKPWWYAAGFALGAVGMGYGAWLYLGRGRRRG